jgi:L-histidine Nalpha-methyltransferase
MSVFETQPISLESQDDAAIAARLHIEYLLNAAQLSVSQDGHDVVAGLSQMPKTLPPHYFYDDRGSQLFEQITALPEYYLTRTETAILQQYAGAIAQMTGPCELVELGSGSSLKTRLLLDAYQAFDAPFHYVPIDVSAGILASSARQLLHDYPTLKVLGLVSTYERALANLADRPRQNRMICFLGSTLGNLSPQECDGFLDQVTAALQPGEYFLLGVDLQKAIAPLEAAYGDRQGITAAFNLNMLSHLNQRFDGDFDVTQFVHWAFYNTAEQQIEMHLKSVTAQTVHLRALNFTTSFLPGETIRSEISRKFNLAQLAASLEHKQLQPLMTWTDPQQWFGLVLCQLTGGASPDA